MAGIYLHIPFCKRACTYCDFHFVTHLHQKERFLRALEKEIELQRDFLPPGETVNTIYFGGGTPSLLSQAELSSILNSLHRYFQVNANAEITLECNPDDVSPEKAAGFRASGVNRLSIGIQSFFDAHLTRLNRSHNSTQAFSAIEHAKKAGFENITADLIYGLPELSLENWEHNLKTFAKMEIPHLSAYNLTVEPGTPLSHAVAKKRVDIPDDDFVLRQFDLLMDFMASEGFDHYETSNFARPGMRSVHNHNYWFGIPFAGMGPGAHSFDGKNRFSNPANNKRYFETIENNALALRKDHRVTTDEMNELIMVRLRTSTGISLNEFGERFGEEERADLENRSKGFLQTGHLVLTNKKHLTLNRKGKYIADYITAELFAG